jgi:hypothetical protein
MLMLTERKKTDVTVIYMLQPTNRSMLEEGDKTEMTWIVG